MAISSGVRAGLGAVLLAGCYDGLSAEEFGGSTSSGASADLPSASTSGDGSRTSSSAGETQGETSGELDDEAETTTDPDASGTDEDSTGTSEPTETGFAHDVRISGVVINQGAPLRLANAEGILEPPTSPVAGRNAQLTLEITPDPAFETRPVLVQVELLHEDGETELLEQQLDLSAPADPQSPGTVGVRWTIPGASLEDRPQYVARVLEVTPTAAEPLSSPRLPAEGVAEFGFSDEAQTLDIMLVPLLHQFNGCEAAPPVDQTFVDQTRNRLLQLFPVRDVTIAVHAAVPYGATMSDIRAMLAWAVNLRASEAPPPETYYVVVATPCDGQFDRTAGGIAPLAYSPGLPSSAPGRVSVNYHYPQVPTSVFDTIAHEVGHNFGRNHVACNGTEAGYDPSYPHAGGILAWEGFDVLSGQNVPGSHFDLMTYCDPAWVSDYGWRVAGRVIESTAQWAGTERAYEGQGIAWLYTPGPSGETRRTRIEMSLAGFGPDHARLTRNDEEIGVVPVLRFPFDHAEGEAFVVPEVAAEPDRIELHGSGRVRVLDRFVGGAR